MKRVGFILFVAGLASLAPMRRGADEAVAVDEAIGVFARALDDPDRGVRFAAAQALEKAARRAGLALAALERGLSDEQWCVRRQAARAIAARGEREILAAAAASDDPRRRDAGTHGLAYLDRIASVDEPPGDVVGPPAIDAPELDDEAWIDQRLSEGFLDVEVDLLAGLRRGEGTRRSVELIARTIERSRALGALADRLDHADPAQRVLALRGLRALARRAPWTEAERRAVPATRWRAALQDESPEVRAAAVWAVRQVAPGEPLPELLDRLDDGDRVVREVAIDALAATPADVVPELLRRWAEGDDRRAIDAARVLRERGRTDARAVDPLRARLVDASPEVRRAAVAALGVVGRDSAVARHAVASRLADSWRDVRMQATIALGGMGEEAVPSLLVALDAANGRVRRLAAQALARFVRTPAFDATATHALVAGLADENLAVSQAAGEALLGADGRIAEPLAERMATGHYGVLPYAERIFEALGPEGAGAVPTLARLVAHGDVNVREVAVRCLGAIGPAAARAVPALVGALRDPRISVRSRAAVALGRVGPRAGRAVVRAAGDADARVRAGAVFALGWIVTAEVAEGEWRLGGPFGPQTPIEIRLPVAEPGPAEATGFVPTAAQRERARELAANDDGEELYAARVRLEEEIGRNAAYDVLRAGLRSSDLDVAVACAAQLDELGLDAWEAERAVELLLPEIFRPGSVASFGDVYGYLGSSEVGALLGYLALSDVDDAERRSTLGELHRIVRWDLLPELLRLDFSADAWTIRGSWDPWMSRDYTDRFRDLRARASVLDAGSRGAALARRVTEAPGEPGFSNALRRRLATLHVMDVTDRKWVLDSVPAARDLPLLVDVARRLFADPETDRLSLALGSLAIALGHLNDPRAEALLAAIEDDAADDCVPSARARLGDPEALRVGLEWEPLLPSRPDLFRALVIEFLQVTRDDGTWFGNPSLVRSRHAGPWSAASFLGWEHDVLVADLSAPLLSWCAGNVPGGRTTRIARALLEKLRAAPPPEMDEYGSPRYRLSDDVELIALVDRDAAIDLLASWTRNEPSREVAYSALVALGARRHAGEILAWWREQVDEERAPEDWLLRRVATPEVVAYLRSVVAGDVPVRAEVRDAATVDLAAAHGAPDDFSLHGATDGEKRRARRLVLAGKPVRAALDVMSARRDRDRTGETDVSGLGSVRAPEAIAWLRDAARRRAEHSYPTVLGQLAVAGEPDARADLWSGIRAGRYRWICYENEADALTLGWSPESFPQLAEELHTNCCRGGHVARMFEEHDAGGPDIDIGWSPTDGMAGGPVTGLRNVLETVGGAWVRVPFHWPTPGTAVRGWRVAVESR